MRRIIVTHGVISGAVIIGIAIATMAWGGGESGAMISLEWLGYLVMLLALSVIFVAVNRYRDEALGGVIRFGTAFRLGLGITAVASITYVAVWEVNLAVTDYAFIDQYTASVLEAKKDEGIGGKELEASVAEMETMKQQYGNPLFRLPMTFLEIFPVGLLISLISALALRNTRLMPAVQPVKAHLST